MARSTTPCQEVFAKNVIPFSIQRLRLFWGCELKFVLPFFNIFLLLRITFYFFRQSAGKKPPLDNQVSRC